MCPVLIDYIRKRSTIPLFANKALEEPTELGAQTPNIEHKKQKTELSIQMPMQKKKAMIAD